MTALLKKQVKAVCSDHTDDDSLSVYERQERTRVRVEQVEAVTLLLKDILCVAEDALAQAILDNAAMNRSVAAADQVGTPTTRPRMPEPEQLEPPTRRVRQRRE